MSENIRDEILKNSPKDNKDYFVVPKGSRIMSNITDLSLNELVDNVKSKKISSKEITSEYVERSKKSNKLNTYIEQTFDNALKNSEKFDKSPNLEKNYLVYRLL